ncbi:MAG TPA: DUF4410 domain-containing protein [Candidatus Acidoferrum sp.]|nr:DUF4410 domain-containing protein [Candidatus Acidoferrum sp.]
MTGEFGRLNDQHGFLMINISLAAVVSGLMVAALTPAKVTDVKTNTSEVHGVKQPSVIHVRSFSISTLAANPQNGGGGGRPHLLGRLRGGEENTVIGQHREQQQEDTLAKLPELLQQALIRDLSKSIAPADSGDGLHASEDSWVVTGEFVEVDTGNRAMQAGVGFGAGKSQLEVRAKVFSGSDMHTPFLTFDSKGASGHLPGAVAVKNPYVAAAKFVMSKREPQQEANKVAQAIANEIGKFMTAQGIPTLKSAQSR